MRKRSSKKLHNSILLGEPRARLASPACQPAHSAKEALVNGLSVRSQGRIRSSGPDVPDWVLAHAGQREAVFQFCEKNAIVDDLEKALGLATRFFPSRDRIEIRVDQDPEEAFEAVVIKVTSHDEVKNFSRAYERCIAQWATDLSPEGIGLISLAYNVL